VQARPTETWAGFPDVGGDQILGDRELADDRWFAESAPTGAPTMVATMEAPTTASVATHYDDNGSATVAQPATQSGRPEASFGPVPLPRKRRLSGASLAGLAAVAGVGAISLGAWGVASNVSDDSKGSGQSAVAIEGVQQVVSLLS
jgi:hypothetical protein